jgi:RNA polymerase sigma-70 factor (ECF subfamily)
VLVTPSFRLENAAAEARLRELYDQHGSALYRYLLGLSYGEAQLAEDLVQETLLRAWRSIETLHADTSRLRPWLFTVARRLAIDAARARKARPNRADDVDVGDLAAKGDPFDHLLTTETIRRGLENLTPEHHQVVVELYLNDRSVGDTAKLLGIPEGTVKSRAFNALRALRRAVGAFD